jgi:hypothetical protein
MPHSNGPRFQLDDIVAFQRRENLSPAQPSGQYVVVARMPQDGRGAYQYRLRPVNNGPLRVAVEDELTRST